MIITPRLAALLVPLLPALATGASVVTLPDGSLTYTESFTLGAVVPDNSGIGMTDTRTLNVPRILEISAVELDLVVTGTWLGDLYAYLRHDTGFAVLLNRPGRSLASPDGSSAVFLDATFFDTALEDSHTAIPSSDGAVGTFQPDGRITDPSNALDTDSRSAFFSSFDGLPASGDWTLFVADVSPGSTATVQSWTLTVTGVPEPSSGFLLGVAAVTAALTVRKRNPPR